MAPRPFPAKLMNLFQKIMSWLCFPLDVLWKHHMGERYCNLVKLLIVGFATKWFMFYIGIFFMGGNTPAMNPKIIHHPSDDMQMGISIICYYGFMLIYWIFGIANLLEIRKRKKAGIQLHSYYIGIPRFLPDKPIVHTLVIPVTDFLIGLGVYQIIRPFGIYLCTAAVFQRWIFKSIFKQEHTAEMDRRDRILLHESKSGQHLTRPTGLVQVAGNGAAHIAADETTFNERWKNVLKSFSSEKKL
jgi:hypothetical protein